MLALVMQTNFIPTFIMYQWFLFRHDNVLYTVSTARLNAKVRTIHQNGKQKLHFYEKFTILPLHSPHISSFFFKTFGRIKRNTYLCTRIRQRAES